MGKKVIGISGITGKVGKGALKMFSGFAEDYIFRFGGRNLVKMKQIVEATAPELLNAEFILLDINKYTECEKFCKECDGVVQCAGPIANIGMNLAQICAEQRIAYVDISGEVSMYSDMMVINKIAKPNKAVSIWSCGINPGLTEIIPKYIMTEKMRATNVLTEYFAGNENFSASAIVDILQSSIQHLVTGIKNERSFCMFKNGKRIKAKQFQKTKVYPSPIGKKITYPYMSDEVYKMLQSVNIEKATYYDSFMMSNIQFPNMEVLRNASLERINQIAQDMVKSHIQFEEQNVYLEIDAQGISDFEENSYNFKLIYNHSGEELSGMIAASIGMMAVNQKIKEYGCYFAWEIVQAETLLQYLKMIKELQIYMDYYSG